MKLENFVCRWILVLALLGIFQASATEPFRFYNTPVRNDSIKGSQIVANATFDVSADYFLSVPSSTDLSWHPSYNILKSDGRVYLRIEKEQDKIGASCKPDNFTCAVEVEITYYKWEPGASTGSTNQVYTIQTTLEVTYSKATGMRYKEKDVYSLPWVHHIEVAVISVSNPDLIPFLTLEAEIEQERYAVGSPGTELEFAL